MSTLNQILREKSLGSSLLARCTCSSKFQDRAYGLGVRVHNIGKVGEARKATCTVCEEVKR